MAASIQFSSPALSLSFQAEPAGDRIARTVDETNFLPPAFDIIPRLLLLLNDPESNSETLAEVIRVDSGLTGDVLQVSNSATFARSARAETLTGAIMRLGLREIYRTVIKVVGASLFSHTGDLALAKLRLWEHSLCAGLAAQCLARELHEDPEVAFTAGLLHDLGKLILNEAVPTEYPSVIEDCLRGADNCWSLERAHFGIDHAAAGGRLLRRWSFPEDLVAAVLLHHEPLHAPGAHRRLACVVALGDVVAHRMGYGYGQFRAQPPLDEDILREFDLDEGILVEPEPEIRREFERASAQFR